MSDLATPLAGAAAPPRASDCGHHRVESQGARARGRASRRVAPNEKGAGSTVRHGGADAYRTPVLVSAAMPVTLVVRCGSSTVESVDSALMPHGPDTSWDGAYDAVSRVAPLVVGRVVPARSHEQFRGNDAKVATAVGASENDPR